ncbi:thrombospondin type 3 repeat-containing protein, partial [Candidatus Thiothrix sp. Deng01]
MQKLIVSLTMASAITAAAHAETPQFPDPASLPPETSSSTEKPSDGMESLTTNSIPTSSVTYTQPTGSPPAVAGTATSATGTYVYPQTNSPTTTTTTAASNGVAYVYPQVDVTAARTNATPAYVYNYAQPQAMNGWSSAYNYMQPFLGGMQSYNPGYYFLPNPMLAPPTSPQMPTPTLPATTWPAAGYRNGVYLQGTPGVVQPAAPSATNTQQINDLTQTLDSLRQQQSDLMGKTQAALTAQEKTIADLKRQLEETQKGKGDLESKITNLQGELAESVKKAELESCKAEKDELADKANATAEMSQQFTELRQNYASLQSEKQQLATALENETKDSDQDGVVDKTDKCPSTPASATVDANGCELPKDADKDGVPDDTDKCPNTQAGVKVDGKGCELDGDGDGIKDSGDQCPGTKPGVKVDALGCDLPPPD